MLGLHRAAELPPQLVRARFNDGVMRDTHDRTLGPIQGHRDFSSLVKQLLQFLLEFCRRFIHESTSELAIIRTPKAPSVRTLPQNQLVLLLTSSRLQWSSQKLTCTREKLRKQSRLDRRLSMGYT
jgi:hypothetical protein